jgi:hypothetical protein
LRRRTAEAEDSASLGEPPLGAVARFQFRDARGKPRRICRARQQMAGFFKRYASSPFVIIGLVPGPTMTV